MSEQSKVPRKGSGVLSPRRLSAALIYLSVLSLLTVSGCESDEERVWKEAKGGTVAEKVEAKERYLEQYPKGKHALLAKQIINKHVAAAFEETRSKDTFAAYQQFIEEFPSSSVSGAADFIERARMELGICMVKSAQIVDTRESEIEVWEKIKKQERLNGYISYLVYFRNGLFVKEAEEYILSNSPSEIADRIKFVEGSKIPHFRMNAVKKLGFTGYPYAIPFLIKLVDDRTELEITTTERTYERTPNGSKELVKTSQTSGQTSPALQAIDALFGISTRDTVGRRGIDRRVVDFAITLLDDEDPRIRAKVAFQLEISGETKAVERMIARPKVEEVERCNPSTVVGETEGIE